MKRSEGVVHVAIRRYLQRHGWLLVAGQYPDGSDDECYQLNVIDPSLACDHSPDPRRHSENKLVPDLVALKRGVLLLIEMKLVYSASDEAKLLTLLGDRRADLFSAMIKFGAERGFPDLLAPEQLTIVPCLGFSHDASFPVNPLFAYLLVSGLDSVDWQLPEVVASPDVIDALIGID